MALPAMMGLIFMENSTDTNEITSDSLQDEMTFAHNFNKTNTLAPVIVPRWSQIMDDAQLSLTIIGVVANLFSLITLIKNGKSFQASVLLLLKHQAFIDTLACSMGALLLTLPYMWLTGVYALDLIVCHGWHGQAIYWGTLWVSIWNLIVIAYERYLAVCRPFNHQDFTKTKIWITMCAGYPLSLATTFGAYLQTHLDDNYSCISEFFFKGKFGEDFMLGFALSTFFTYYAIPVIMFTIFYGLVVNAFRKRSQQSNLASSRVIDSATTELTRTAIVVTLIFFVALGYDLWYYVLGYVGVTEYKMNSPVQKIGVLFSTCNSVCNPFVYALLMPAYRRSVMLTMGCATPNKKEKQKLSTNA